MRDEFLWVEKYRPKTIEECILPEQTKKTFLEFLNKGEIPNMLLAGPAGCGKTTVAKALCNQLGVDVYVINGSDEGRFLDTVRNNAKNFASTVSFSSESEHKVIIIDEAVLEYLGIKETHYGETAGDEPAKTYEKNRQQFKMVKLESPSWTIDVPVRKNK